MTDQPAVSRTWVFEFVLLAAIWGASFLFMRIGTLQFGPVPTAAVRVVIAALFLLPILFWQRQSGLLLRRWKALLLVGLLNSGIPFVCYGFALLSISTGLSSILNATTPLFGALIAWAWLKDRLDAWRSIGLVLGFMGVALLAWDKTGFQPGASNNAAAAAVLACLLATLCYGLAASFTRRHLHDVPPLVTATGSQVGAALLLALPAALSWPEQMPDNRAWLALLVVGVLCTAAAYILYFRLINSAGPARALAVTFVIPVFALVFGVLFLQESITLWMLLCGAVVLLGTALATGLLKRSSMVGMNARLK